MERHEKKKHQNIIEQFCAAESLEDIAGLLSFTSKELSYILYILDGGREKQYHTFTIKKRSGGKRTISAPITALKEVQRRLNELLQIIYWEKPSVHSFLKKRSIITNATPHVHRRYIFNIDLKDFFPSINFGRVRGLFIAGPYHLNTKAATIIAQISCHENQLPQGSPCSPIISNMICAKMDSQLQKLAKKERCAYTRYADDITFSTNMPEFPANVAYWEKGETCVGEDLKDIIKSNGFEINNDKTNFQARDMRQEVTGLVVNEFVNVRRKRIRQARAMLHAWEKYGLTDAGKEYFSKYCLNEKEHEKQNFKAVVLGKIEFIRMVRKDNIRLREFGKKRGQTKEDVFKKLFHKYYELILREGDDPIIRTEGSTDWMHLKAAWEVLSRKGKYSDLDIDLFRVKDALCFGNKNLIRFCENAKNLRTFKKKIICLFDSDDKNINKTHSHDDYRYWGNNVYSFVLPDPKGYSGKHASIEFYYDTKFIKTYDTKKRRLFFSNEFRPDGTHKKLSRVTYGIYPWSGKYISGWKKHIEGEKKILDSGVYSTKKPIRSIALSKKSFVQNILKKEKGFDKANFDEFEKIFDIVTDIIKH